MTGFAGCTFGSSSASCRPTSTKSKPEVNGELEPWSVGNGPLECERSNKTDKPLRTITHPL